MARYFSKNVICPLCGKEFAAQLLAGFTQSGPSGLDGNPHDPAIFDRVTLCPHCGYATANIRRPAYPGAEKWVQTENYREMLRSRKYGEEGKKLLLAGFLARKAGDHSESAYCYLSAWWYLTENRSPEAGRALKQAIEQYRLYLAEEENHAAALVLIDLLRQAGEFDEASETADSLENYLEDPEHRDILRIERKWIGLRDSRAHRAGSEDDV
ncbi:MAG: hypothetical protein ACI4V1_06895 [Eubacteriales bacterium]